MPTHPQKILGFGVQVAHRVSSRQANFARLPGVCGALRTPHTPGNVALVNL